MENQSQELDIINKSFDVFGSLNSLLLKGFEEDKKLSFLDYFAFQSTSYAISIIHNAIYIGHESIANIFILRSLIESISEMKMYLTGGVTKESEELLREYSYIAEHRIYHKYEDLDGKLFHLKDIDENFERTKKKYTDLGTISFKNLNDLLRSKLPFLLEKESVDSIIKKYCPEAYDYYHLLSVWIHPNDLLLTVPTIQEEKESIYLAEIWALSNLLKITIENYPNLEINSTKALSNEKTQITNNPLNIKYLGYVTNQCNALHHLAYNLRKRLNDNTQSYLLEELANYIHSMAIDKLYGYSELVKCKIKPVLETLALCHYIESRPHTEENSYLDKLITKHTRIRLMEVHGMDPNNELLSAYELYKKECPSISYDDFKKAFTTNLGFIFEKTSINQLVYSSIDDFYKSNPENGEILKLFYDESEFLSHGNGFMLQSNTGAFMDSSSAIGLTDETIVCYLRGYLIYWMAYDETEGDHHNEKTIHDIKNSIKIVTKNMIDKDKLDKKYKDRMSNY